MVTINYRKAWSAFVQLRNQPRRYRIGIDYHPVEFRRHYAVDIEFVGFARDMSNPGLFNVLLQPRYDAEATQQCDGMPSAHESLSKRHAAHDVPSSLCFSSVSAKEDIHCIHRLSAPT